MHRRKCGHNSCAFPGLLRASTSDYRALQLDKRGRRGPIETHASKWRSWVSTGTSSFECISSDWLGREIILIYYERHNMKSMRFYSLECLPLSSASANMGGSQRPMSPLAVLLHCDTSANAIHHGIDRETLNQVRCPVSRPMRPLTFAHLVQLC